MSLSARPVLHRNFHRLAWFALIMTASTIMFGSFVRLSDAGLSCPDWPTCYGRVTWPQHAEEVIGHEAGAGAGHEPKRLVAVSLRPFERNQGIGARKGPCGVNPDEHHAVLPHDGGLDGAAGEVFFQPRLLDNDGQ